MSVQVTWHYEPHILQATFQGSVTVEDSIRMVSRLIHMMGHRMNPVYLVCDVSQMEAFTVDLQFLRSLAFEIKLHNIGLIAVIGRSYAFDMFMDTLARISGTEIQWVENTEQAVDKILKLEPGLAYQLDAPW